jgi:hypothetical protein
MSDGVTGALIAKTLCTAGAGATAGTVEARPKTEMVFVTDTETALDAAARD